MADMVTYSDKQLVFSDPGLSGTFILSNVHLPTLLDAIYDHSYDAGDHQYEHVLPHDSANCTSIMLAV